MRVEAYRACRESYEAGLSTTHKAAPASDLITCDTPVEMLGLTSHTPHTPTAPSNPQPALTLSSRASRSKLSLAAACAAASRLWLATASCYAVGVAAR